MPNGQPNPMFIQDYFRHLTELEYIDGIMILTSTHEAVLEELKNRDMDYYVIIPEEGLINEYINRYKARGSTQEFIDLVSSNWHAWLQDIKSKHKYFELRSQQTLTDFMIETYEIGHSGATAMSF